MLRLKIIAANNFIIVNATGTLALSLKNSGTNRIWIHDLLRYQSAAQCSSRILSYRYITAMIFNLNMLTSAVQMYVSSR